MKKNDLIRFIQRKGDDKFQNDVLKWINASSENRAYFHRIKAEYVSSFSSVSGIDLEKEYQVFRKRISTSYKIFYRFAAVLIIGLLAGGTLLYWSGNFPFVHEKLYHTVAKQQMEITLDDGSTVVLNSKSSLKLASNYNRSARIVFLEGEALFNVSENKKKPFIVKTLKGVNVRVLGTQFNVKSYASNNTVETTLVSGKVEILDNESSNLMAVLEPRQRATFHKKERKIELETVETDEITSWTEGILYYENSSMAEVLEDIERWYDVQFTIEDNEIALYTLSGRFTKDYSINEVLTILQTSSPIIFEFEGDEKHISLSKMN
ncbi:FecR family protein [Labilibaculum euxinus]